MRLSVREEPLGLEPVESLQVERLEAERLGRVGGAPSFRDLSVGEIPPKAGIGADIPR